VQIIKVDKQGGVTLLKSKKFEKVVYTPEEEVEFLSLTLSSSILTPLFSSKM